MSQVLNPRARVSQARSGRFKKIKLIFCYSLFLSTIANLWNGQDFWGASSSSFAFLDVFPMITSGLRDFIQEPYSGSPGHVRLNSALVAMPLRGCIPVLSSRGR